MESTFRFFRVRGIPVGAHWSWLLVFAVVVWSLSVSLDHAGADVFIVPLDEMSQAEDTPGLDVHGTRTLTQSLQVLRSTA